VCVCVCVYGTKEEQGGKGGANGPKENELGGMQRLIESDREKENNWVSLSLSFCLSVCLSVSVPAQSKRRFSQTDNS